MWRPKTHALLGILEPPVAITVQVCEDAVGVRQASPRPFDLRE
jgi:hypothetical protein